MYINKERVILTGLGLLFAAFAIWFIFFSPPTNNQAVMYEDEMIVPIDDFTALQEAVITLQEGMKLLLAGETPSPNPPVLTPAQQQFECMAKTDDYKDGFLEIPTVLSCMGLEFVEEVNS